MMEVMSFAGHYCHVLVRACLLAVDGILLGPCKVTCLPSVQFILNRMVLHIVLATRAP